MAMYDDLLNSIKESSAANTAQSQAFAREEMAFNAEQAALTRSWQENMSNTAHQREVKDLIAAGLNPILSTGGQGAATPSGATATGKSGKVDESYSSAVAGYLQSLIASATQINAAQISANAMLGSASMSAAASRYGADRSSAASILGSTLSSSASRYASNKSYASKRDFPSSPFSLLGSVYQGYQKYIGQPFANFVSSLFKK